MVKEAKEYLKNASYDTLCMDYSLRDGTAIEVLQYINAQKLSCRTLVLSGHQEKDIQATVLCEGAKTYIVEGTGNFLMTISDEE